MWALPELVEAAARAGDTELAGDALERLAETTQPCGTDFALGIEARCRALLSDGAAADDAVSRSDRPAEPYAGCRRSSPARICSTGSGCAARAGASTRASSCAPPTTCSLAIGMEAFAERARRELLATGEKVRKRSVETRDELTPQEEQIARLARDGLSNPEIGAQLFLSRAHRRMASAQGLHQARHQLPQGASGSASRQPARLPWPPGLAVTSTRSGCTEPRERTSVVHGCDRRAASDAHRANEAKEEALRLPHSRSLSAAT